MGVRKKICPVKYLHPLAAGNIPFPVERNPNIYNDNIFLKLKFFNVFIYAIPQ